jgi:hypothetical protein
MKNFELKNSLLSKFSKVIFSVLKIKLVNSNFPTDRNSVFMDEDASETNFELPEGVRILHIIFL